MDFFLLWDRILEYIDKNDHQYYKMFSYDVFPISLSDSTLVISPSRPYLVRWIDNVYKSKLEQIIRTLTGKDIRVEIRPPESEESSPAMPEPSAGAEPTPPAAPFPDTPHVSPVTPEPAPLPENEPAEDPFPQEVAPPDFSNLKPKTADEVVLPDIRNYEELHEPSLFDNAPKGETKKTFQPNPVNEEYTFETFVHGNCNEIAYQAA